MGRLIWGYAGRTYHIVGNLMHWLKCKFKIKTYHHSSVDRVLYSWPSQNVADLDPLPRLAQCSDIGQNIFSTSLKLVQPGKLFQHKWNIVDWDFKYEHPEIKQDLAPKLLLILRVKSILVKYWYFNMMILFILPDYMQYIYGRICHCDLLNTLKMISFSFKCQSW